MGGIPIRGEGQLNHRGENRLLAEFQVWVDGKRPFIFEGVSNCCPVCLKQDGSTLGGLRDETQSVETGPVMVGTEKLITQRVYKQ